MKRTVPVPIARYESKLADTPGWWAPLAHQGPGGLYAVMETDKDHVFQVFKLDKEKAPEKVTEPFMTPAGALRFAEWMAAGGDPNQRIS
jgi:hypothetical protein